MMREVDDEKRGFILDEDVSLEKKNDDDNPFKELKNLISKQEIDVKTVLNDHQVIALHKLNTLEQVFRNDDNLKSHECAELLKYFTERYMTLVINKEGLSRRQFIDALHKGDEKVQESKQLKIRDGMISI